MIFNETGSINRHLLMLGHAAMPIYLVDGTQPVIIDAGVASLGRTYVNRIRELLKDRQPAYCLLTHSHFDHCGAAGILKDAFPQMQIVASEAAKQVFSRPSAIERIHALNQAAIKSVAQFGVEASEEMAFQPFDIDLTVQEGDTLNVSEQLNIHVIETPGHTKDCLSYFIPGASILFASEAAGQITPAGYIVSDCLADYDQYYTSLQHLSSLAVKYLCLGHLAVYTDADVPVYFTQSESQCRQFHQRVCAEWQACDGDLATVMARVKAVEYDSYEGPKQTLEAYLINLEARVKAVNRSQKSFSTHFGDR